MLLCCTSFGFVLCYDAMRCEYQVIVKAMKEGKKEGRVEGRKEGRKEE